MRGAVSQAWPNWKRPSLLASEKRCCGKKLPGPYLGTVTQHLIWLPHQRERVPRMPCLTSKALSTRTTQRRRTSYLAYAIIYFP